MEHETEGTVPPHLKWVWVEAVETALGSGDSLQRPACQVCLWLLDLVCGTFSSLTSQPGACTPYPLPWRELPGKGSSKV